KAWISRVAALLLGEREDVDSWEDLDDDGADLRFQHICLQSVSQKALTLSWQKRQPVGKEEAMSRQALKNGGTERQEVLYAVKGKRDHAIQELSSQLSVELLEKHEDLPAAELPGWFWADAEDPGMLQARQLFYLVTGQDLPEEHQPLVRSVVTQKSPGEEDLSKLFMLILATVSSSLVSSSHLHVAFQSLSASRTQLLRFGKNLLPGTLDSSPADLRSLLVLGSLCWRLLTCLQDAYCLLGGEGALFKSHLRLDGGPVVLTEAGPVRKAANGYRVGLRGWDDEQVITADQLEQVRGRLQREGAEIAQSRDGKLPIVKNLSGEVAFKFHRRWMILSGAPAKLEVKALD
ncbi:unnamed protein product, partial [Symbiodinium pilosum]